MVNRTDADHTRNSQNYFAHNPVALNPYPVTAQQGSGRHVNRSSNSPNSGSKVVQKLPQWFLNLSISHKQLAALITSEIVAIAALGVGSVLVFRAGLQNQLFNQATSEVAVIDSDYNQTLSQMEASGRSQTEHAAMIDAARFYNAGRAVNPALQTQVQQLLQTESRAHGLEIAALVSKDLQVIATANSNRVDSSFNPNGLVSEVLKNPQTIKANVVARWDELPQELLSLSSDLKKQDILIRYTVIPVRDPATKAVLGALVTGAIVNGKPAIIEKTLDAFGGGYSAIYLRKSDGRFVPATALNQPPDDAKPAQPNSTLPDQSLLKAAAAKKGEPVTGRMAVGDQTYTFAAQAIPNRLVATAGGTTPVFGKQPGAILVRGTPETGFNQVLGWSLKQEAIAISLSLLVMAIWAMILRRTITKPIRQLESTALSFTGGNFGERATIFAFDEVGQLATTFNYLADNMTVSDVVLAERARESQLLADVASSRSFSEQDVQAIFQKALDGARQVLTVDRMVIYRFKPDWTGYISSEAVGSEWVPALNNKIEDPCIPADLLAAYRNDRVVPTSDVFNAGFHPEHLALMRRLQIRANLVVPILKGEQLFGLLIAHHCATTHLWEDTEINFMRQLAAQLGTVLDRVTFLQRREMEAERSQLLRDITLQLTQADTSDAVLAHLPLVQVRELLRADRVILYRFDDDWRGTITAESVGNGFPKALGATIYDPCFAKDYVNKYRQGRIQATPNIYEAGLTTCHLNQLEPFAVKANLVAPILQGEQLLGLLIAHQCSAPRNWEQIEIDLFAQVTSQIALALDRCNLLLERELAAEQARLLAADQRQQKEHLQHQLVELLTRVEGVAEGDLTVRAEVTPGEIGTVADFFNAIVECLRQIVTQVKQSAIQVSDALNADEAAISELAHITVRQAEETSRTLNSVEQMVLSIQAVAENARQAAEVSSQASSTAASGSAAMDRTVQNIMSLRSIIDDTAKKMKHLGESSQQISQVVSMIEKIALQTNILSINAGIEAARAGEEGQGFSVVAEEIGELAVRSAAATSEIEKIVSNIQVETGQVLDAMGRSITKVVEGTHLVEDAKQNLHQMLQVSQYIDQLVRSISDATVSQTQTSQAIANLMKEVVYVSQLTSDSSSRISSSLQRTVGIADELQASVQTFNVGTET